MPGYRAYADLRRHLRDRTWHLGGVVVDGAWRRARPGVYRPSARLIEARLCTAVELTPIVAPSRRAAVGIALAAARDLGYEAPADLYWIAVGDPRLLRIELRLDDLLRAANLAADPPSSIR